MIMCVDETRQSLSHSSSPRAFHPLLTLEFRMEFSRKRGEEGGLDMN